MSASYWDKVLQNRLSRRRALAASGAVGLGTAILSACGGGDEGDGEKEAAGLLSPIKDDTKDLKRGGTWIQAGTSAQVTPVSFDPMQSGAHVAYSWWIYNTLFGLKQVRMANPTGEFEGVLVESSEWTADHLTLTLKLKPGVLFAPKPPVNAREMDADDVVFSWKRFAASGAARASVSYAANPKAPVVGMTKIDKYTVQVKINAPSIAVIPLLGNAFTSQFWVVPKEAEDPSKLDLKTNPIGTGPFYLVSHTPNVSGKLQRNPGFKAADKRDLPYFDAIDYRDMPEYAATLSQFKAGNIYDSFFSVQSQDMLPTAKDVPDLELWETPALGGGTVRALFGRNPESPFKDERVRQAYSMIIDRDFYGELAFNKKDFEAAGVPVNTVWETALSPSAGSGGFGAWVLDPKGKDFGENAKYYKYNVADAKALLKAATGQESIDTDVTYSLAFAPVLYTRINFILAMMRESGLFRPTIKEIQFATEWNPKFRLNKGVFTGMGLTLDLADPDPALTLFSNYNSQGQYYFGGDPPSDPTIEEMTLKMLQEFDTKKRTNLAFDLQKHEAKTQHRTLTTAGSGFRLSWPAHRGRGVWRPDYDFHYLWTHWLDPTKKPISKA